MNQFVGYVVQAPALLGACTSPRQIGSPGYIRTEPGMNLVGMMSVQAQDTQMSRNPVYQQ